MVKVCLWGRCLKSTVRFFLGKNPRHFLGNKDISFLKRYSLQSALVKQNETDFGKGSSFGKIIRHSSLEM